jgi:hypothetical protein
MNNIFFCVQDNINTYNNIKYNYFAFVSQQAAMCIKMLIYKNKLSVYICLGIKQEQS